MIRGGIVPAEEVEGVHVPDSGATGADQGPYRDRMPRRYIPGLEHEDEEACFSEGSESKELPVAILAGFKAMAVALTRGDGDAIMFPCRQEKGVKSREVAFLAEKGLPACWLQDEGHAGRHAVSQHSQVLNDDGASQLRIEAYPARPFHTDKGAEGLCGQEILAASQQPANAQHVSAWDE